MACRDGKIVHQYRASNCGFIPHDLVYWVHEDRKGNWWLGTYKGLSVRYQDGREYCFNQLPDADKLLSKEITSIMEDNNGSLWLATNNNGIVHVTGNMEQPGSLQCKNYCIENGLLPVNIPLCFLLDKSGKVWVGTDFACMTHRMTAFGLFIRNTICREIWLAAWRKTITETFGWALTRDW